MARTFDNTDDNINYGTSAGAGLTACTASAIIRITSNRSTEKMLFTRQASGTFRGKLFLFQPNFSGRQNTVGIYLTYDGDTNSHRAYSATDTISLNVWTVVVSTWAGTGNAPQLYTCALGGTLTEVSYADQSATGTTPDNDSASLRIGSRDALNLFADADICEVGLWNRVLPSATLAQLGLGYVPLCFANGLEFYSGLSGANTPEMGRTATAQLTGVMTGTTVIAHPDGVKFPLTNSVIGAMSSRSFVGVG